MKITDDQIIFSNRPLEINHNEEFLFLADRLGKKNIDLKNLVQTLEDFQVAIPSWALGAGGTRFGRFSYGGEPSTLYDKIEDVGLIHKLTDTAGAISLHIPWDIPDNPQEIKEFAAELNVKFDAVNSNTFQDQPVQKHSYKFGSLCHVNSDIRAQAVEHNKQVIDIGKKLGSESITIWLADGSSFPGQMNFRNALNNTCESLKEIYNHLPEKWKMYIEYKPYEPNFYSMVIQDWGTSFILASECGEKAFTLVDLGHHLPNTNIEQIVSTLISRGKLGGFHFNDSKYGDDDLTVGSIKPYQLFLIFTELVMGMDNNHFNNPPLAWMIDASHNLKDPLEDLIQSLEAIQIAQAQALIVDYDELENARSENDVTLCQSILQEAFRTDVRPIIREARKRKGAAIDPVDAYRRLKVRSELIKARGEKSKATGL